MPQSLPFARSLICGLLPAALGLISVSRAADLSASASSPAELVFSLGAKDLATFERHAAIAKELGATHLVITDQLPLATWEMTPPGDPYPAWYVHQPDFRKIFPPAELRPYVDSNYAEQIAALLEARCKILRKYGLKAYWSANEPQVLPEAFFTDHPDLRGPRVDQANRSRFPRFAPCVDEPETLRL